jgi:tRNA pseudouridine38-40 synthase
MGNALKYRYFIKLAYNGANYHGWQIQPNAPSVQQTINEAVSTILQQEINIVGCGRTDTGVHAKEFFAHFDLSEDISAERDDITRRLNHFLPKDISIFKIIPVDSDTHARFDAVSRSYKYIVSRRKDPFYKDFSYYVHDNLNIEKMNEAAETLFEFTDFTSFSKLHTQVKTNDCRIMQAQWEEKDHLLIFKITADRFLRNMVRAIVGTLLDVGRGKISTDDFKSIIESKNRSNAGYSVPAKGLFLTEVDYPPNIFKRVPS